MGQTGPLPWTSFLQECVLGFLQLVQTVACSWEAQAPQTRGHGESTCQARSGHGGSGVPAQGGLGLSREVLVHTRWSIRASVGLPGKKPHPPPSCDLPPAQHHPSDLPTAPLVPARAPGASRAPALLPHQVSGPTSSLLSSHPHIRDRPLLSLLPDAGYAPAGASILGHAGTPVGRVEQRPHTVQPAFRQKRNPLHCKYTML